MSDPRGDPSPPRLARRLLALILPREERDAIVSDLDEFHRTKTRHGSGGRLWYWRQVLAYAPWRSRLRRRSPGRLAEASGEVRRAWRGLVRAPEVSVPAVLTVALAIGVNTAVYAVVDELLLAPLPYDDARELVQVWMADPAEPGSGSRFVTPNARRRWREGLRGSGGLGVFDVSTATLLGVGDPEDVILTHVEPHLLRRLGPDPVLGRSLAPDDAPDATLLLAHAFWRTRLGGDPEVLGRSLTLAGRSHLVVGVARPGFRLPLDREVVGWTSMDPPPADWVLGDWPVHAALAWRDGVPAATGATSLRETLGSLLHEPEGSAADRPTTAEEARVRDLAPPGLQVRTAPLEELVRPTGTTLPVLLGAVTLVLVLACLNVALLLLARGLARGPELGVRLALGARPATLARLLALEAGLLAVAGAALGAALAGWVLRGLLALDPGHLPGWADVRLTPRVGAYVALVTLAAALVSGLLPALDAARTAPRALLGRHRSGGRRGGSLARGALLAAQTAMTLMLLVGMAVLVRSWAAVQAVDPGFEPSGVHTARVVLPPERYAPGDGPAHVDFFEKLRRALEARPGIARAAVATGLPMAVGLEFLEEVAWEDDDLTLRRLSWRGVSPGYFETLAIPLVAGRFLQPSDDRDAERVVVLNRSAVRSLLGRNDPDAVLGRRLIEVGDRAPAPRRVVGVVEDQLEAGPDRPAEPRMFVSWLQSRPFGRMWIAVRPSYAGSTVWTAMQAALRSVDPTLPLVDAAPLTDRVSATVAPRRFSLVLVLALGALSLVIAVVGMAGLAAFVASRRRREVAVRVALGAGTVRAVLPALIPPLLSIGVGLGLGIAGVATARRALASLAYGVTPLDPYSLIAAIVLLTCVAATATLLPAWRATRGGPREVLDA